MAIMNPSECNDRITSLVLTWIYTNAYLWSFQNDVLSSSGTISVTFRYLAMATISHICMIVQGKWHVGDIGFMNFKYADRLCKVKILTPDRI